MDSDKNSNQTAINNTKKRIINEVEINNGFAWVTKGKEIENYISAGVVSNWLSKKGVGQIGQYDNFFDYLDLIKKGEGKRFASQKSLLAERLSPYIKREHIEGVLDLSEKLEKLCGAIKKWNSL